MIERIICRKGELLVAMLDEEDSDLLHLSWGLSGGETKSRYVYVYSKKLKLPRRYIHMVIFERKLGRELDRREQPDHKDQNKLNNTRDNLRLATISQNRANTPDRPGRSLPRGVYRDKHKFSAGLRANGERYHLGNFNTPEEAHEAFKQKHAEVWGEFSPYYNEVEGNDHALFRG